jgi:hypothetical protein
MKASRDGMVMLAAAGALALVAALPAGATTVAVSNGGELYLSEATTGSGSAPFGNISGLAIPGNYSYQDSWAAPQSTVVAGTTYGFYDDFVFTIGAGRVDSVSSSITLGNMLGISGMQVRLYDYNANGQAAPLLGTPVPGSAFDAWSSTVSFPGGTTTVDVLPTTTLAAGTYAIEVRGTATGQDGGNYTGSLNVAPVPLPSAVYGLLSGLGLFAAGELRRRGSRERASGDCAIA